MDIIAWLWWAVSALVGVAVSIVWFLISGWVSTLLQIALLIGAVYFLKYGWQRAPAEIWRRSRTFGKIFLGWVRARDTDGRPEGSAIRIVKVKEFGDINVSTLLSLLMLLGMILATKL